MLVLSRKTDQRIYVDFPEGPARQLILTVVAVNGGIVRLGFEADRDVAIRRDTTKDERE